MKKVIYFLTVLSLLLLCSLEAFSARKESSYFLVKIIKVFPVEKKVQIQLLSIFRYDFGYRPGGELIGKTLTIPLKVKQRDILYSIKPGKEIWIKYIRTSRLSYDPIVKNIIRKNIISWLILGSVLYTEWETVIGQYWVKIIKIGKFDKFNNIRMVTFKINYITDSEHSYYSFVRRRVGKIFTVPVKFSGKAISSGLKPGTNTWLKCVYRRIWYFKEGGQIASTHKTYDQWKHIGETAVSLIDSKHAMFLAKIIKVYSHKKSTAKVKIQPLHQLKLNYHFLGKEVLNKKIIITTTFSHDRILETLKSGDHIWFNYQKSKYLSYNKRRKIKKTTTITKWTCLGDLVVPQTTTINAKGINNHNMKILWHRVNNGILSMMMHIKKHVKPNTTFHINYNKQNTRDKIFKIKLIMKQHGDWKDTDSTRKNILIQINLKKFTGKTIVITNDVGSRLIVVKP